ncbi:MAG TPA: hypothetical protein ENI24_10490 [Methylophaga sp.]|nr:hypothetical protein [Methylophaga sp.]
MSTSLDLTTILSPLIKQCQPQSLLLAGDIAIHSCNEWHDAKPYVLKTPFSIQQLVDLPTIDLAIISEITETLPKTQAMQWLGLMRNAHAQHIIVISEITGAMQQGWQLADYLALGMKRMAIVENYHLYSYNIETYQLKRDWLNSRFWANPDNFDKYRW